MNNDSPQVQQTKLFDTPIPTGADLRDHGIAQVMGHQLQPWKIRATLFMLQYGLDHTAFIVDEVRQAWDKAGGEQPTNPNAWGGITMALRARGLLIRTGRARQAGSASGHASWRMEWRHANRAPVA